MVLALFSLQHKQGRTGGNGLFIEAYRWAIRSPVSAFVESLQASRDRGGMAVNISHLFLGIEQTLTGARRKHIVATGMGSFPCGEPQPANPGEGRLGERPLPNLV
jgi:hypothetical protein